MWNTLFSLLIAIGCGSINYLTRAIGNAVTWILSMNKSLKIIRQLLLELIHQLGFSNPFRLSNFNQ